MDIDRISDRIRGCLIGGAAGDALGYPVEFMSAGHIFAEYGPSGIQAYECDRKSGKALISDDTQMTLFTAAGLLAWRTRAAENAAPEGAAAYVAAAYQDWLRTQTEPWQGAPPAGPSVSWLADVPELYSRRAPGNTCLAALIAQRKGDGFGTVEAPPNNSSGCGGVMRVAPMGLLALPRVGIGDVDRTGAAMAAVTHGHPMGYLPAAVLTHIVSRLVYPETEQTLKEIVTEARDAVVALYPETPFAAKLAEMIDHAIRLAENDRRDVDNIRLLGEGWVGDEALVIALYCALRYPDDFSAGLIASVNHSGDSDSTGAILGNILGAKLGYAAIDEQWKTDLELADVILTVADDLSRAGQESGLADDAAWARKYRRRSV